MIRKFRSVASRNERNPLRWGRKLALEQLEDRIVPAIVIEDFSGYAAGSLTGKDGGLGWGATWAVSGTNQAVAGIGMVEGGGVINPDNVTLFAVTAVHLYDGRTFERLLWQRPGFSIGGSMGNVVNGPHRRLDRTWWPATPQAVHSEKYKAAVRALLAESIGATVPEMLGLIGKKGGA